jgi:hypothetical protein
MDKRTLALGEQCVGEVVERAPTTVAPVAFDPWPVVVIAPGTDGVTLATGTLEQVICPPKRMAIGMAGVDVEACVEMGEHRHDGQSPLVTRSTLEQIGRFSLLITLYPSANCDLSRVAVDCAAAYLAIPDSGSEFATPYVSPGSAAPRQRFRVAGHLAPVDG